MGFLETIQHEWGVISAAPWTFAFLVATSAGAAYWFAQTLFKREIASLNAIIRQLEAGAGTTAAEQAKPLAARHLTPQQRLMLHHALDGNGGRIMLSTNGASPEAIDYREEFEAVFVRAGWGTVIQNVMGAGRNPPTGIALYKQGEPTHPQQVVAQALTDAGIQYDWRDEPPNQDDCHVVLFVGVRP